MTSRGASGSYPRVVLCDAPHGRTLVRLPIVEANTCASNDPPREAERDALEASIEAAFARIAAWADEAAVLAVLGRAGAP